MKWINRLLPSIIFGIILLSNTAVVEARELCPPGFTTLCQIKLENGGDIIGKVAVFLIIISIIVSLFFLLFGALRWVTSAGDKGKADSARQTLVGAIVGLVISLLSFLIINVVLFLFTGKGLSGLTIPKL